MNIHQRLIWLTVLGYVTIGTAHATLPAYVNKLESLGLVIRPVHHQAINAPVKIWYTRYVNGKSPDVPLCEGTVSVTCNRVPENNPVTVYNESQLKWKSNEVGAVTIPLPSTPGIYTYTATLRIADPDDPANVFTLTSPPVTLGVFAVLERTTVTIRPTGGTVISPTIADAPRVTFPPGALTGEAQVTLETISVPPDPRLPNTEQTDLGHAAYVYVKGAALKQGAILTLGLATQPPPKYPHSIFPNLYGALRLKPSGLAGLVVPYRKGEYIAQAVARWFEEEYPPSFNSESKDWEFGIWFILFDYRGDYERSTGKKWEEPKEGK